MRKTTLGKTGLKVSVLGLGTTAIGYSYGLGERPIPTENESLELLRSVIDLGVTYIDTAHAYGLAEERIGKSGIAKNSEVVIATKCGNILDRQEHISEAELETQIRCEIEDSLRKLRVDTLTLVQVHGGSSEQISSGMLAYIMNKLKKEGKLRHVGISTRGEKAPLSAIHDGNFETLQLAYNILDQRMEKRVFQEAKNGNIGVINRSVLLKGALTPGRKYLPKGLPKLIENANVAEKIAKEIGLDLPSLAIRFVISNNHVDTALIGSSKILNIKRAITAIEQGPLPRKILEKLSALSIENFKEIDPKYWPQ